MVAAFDAGLMIRVTGDIIALSPPLIIESSHIERIIDTLRNHLATRVATAPRASVAHMQ